MKSSRIILGLAILGAMAVGLTGCGKGEQANASPAQPEAAAPAPAPAATADAAPADGAKPIVEVYVPCGMVLTYRTLEKEFEKLHDCDVKIHLDNAVVLLRLIRKGERPDVLISPGRLEMKMMEDEGYVEPDSVVTFGTFKMIVVVPASNPGHIESWKDLTKPEVKSIAVAAEDQNSVGMYAIEALKGCGIYDQVKGKIRQNWHALTAVEWVCNARVDAGLYFNSCPFESGQEKLGDNIDTYKIIGELPEDSYEPIKAQAGRLKEAHHPELAKTFLDYIMSPDGQKIIASTGIDHWPGESHQAEN